MTDSDEANEIVEFILHHKSLMMKVILETADVVLDDGLVVYNTVNVTMLLGYHTLQMIPGGL